MLCFEWYRWKLQQVLTRKTSVWWMMSSSVSCTTFVFMANSSNSVGTNTSAKLWAVILLTWLCSWTLLHTVHQRMSLTPDAIEEPLEQSKWSMYNVHRIAFVRHFILAQWCRMVKKVREMGMVSVLHVEMVEEGRQCGSVVRRKTFY